VSNRLKIVSDFESQSKMDIVQETLERQEQNIHELIEKIVAVTITQAPPGLVEVLVADQQQHGVP